MPVRSGVGRKVDLDESFYSERERGGMIGMMIWLKEVVGRVGLMLGASVGLGLMRPDYQPCSSDACSSDEEVRRTTDPTRT